MTQLTRYVLSELLKVFLVTLAGMTVLLLIVGLAQEAIRQGLGAEPLLKLIPYAMPNALRFAVPGTILFAACSVFGRMSAAGEITAIKSLGVSPLRTLRPALALAFLLSLVAVWLNDVAVSWGARGMQRVVLYSVEQIAYGMLRSQQSYSTSQFSINVQAVRDHKLIRPMILMHRKDDSLPVMLNAEQAELRLDAQKGVLRISLSNGELAVGDEGSVTFPHYEWEVPIAQASRAGELARRPSNLPLRQVASETRRQRDLIDGLRWQFAVEAACEMLTGDIAALTSQGWAERQRQLRDARYRLSRLHTEPWRRWANGFSCFFFVLVGAPLAIRMRNADLWTSFAVCFLPILIVYYPLLACGVDGAKNGDLPPYAVWMGNAMLGVVGLWLIRRVIRH